MRITAFRVQMYRSVLDSGWVDVQALTVIVGKNESGKSSLLKALHKLNPYTPEPYFMEREWPRGHRRDRSDKQIAVTGRFELAGTELQQLREITDQKIDSATIEVTRDYGGRLEIHLPADVFPDRLHPNDVDAQCAALPPVPAAVGEGLRACAHACVTEVRRLANEGRFTELAGARKAQLQSLQAAVTPGDSPQSLAERQFVDQYTARLGEVVTAIQSTPSMRARAHEFVVKALPTFTYMDDYRTFTGTALLDQVKQRKDKKKLTPEDTTLLTIMELSGLKLDEEVTKAGQEDREQRQYDLDDAAKTLTDEISTRWRQRKYEVQFRADGHQFFTMVRDDLGPGLIKLEERSKGFQWFFSFDLLFMRESKGTFRNCVILLDEPGLHLHADAQRDLLRRLEAYAGENTVIYSTHLPFMIDLRRPERIRVISESKEGTKVSEDLTQSQPEGKLTLQAALGISGSASYLLSRRNLVVEGVDDYWFISELSNLMVRSGQSGLDDDVFVTPAGGASEAAYIATFMIGQRLDVVVLLDSDKAGEDARDSLIKKWLTRYPASLAKVVMVGAATGLPGEAMIEDLFPESFYLARVESVYGKQLAAKGVTLSLRGGGSLIKRVERFFAESEVPFNKGSVAKAIRHDLLQMKTSEELPSETRARAAALFTTITAALPGR